MTWSYFLEGFQKSEILKNAVSGRWCLDSRPFHAHVYERQSQSQNLFKSGSYITCSYE